MTEGTLPGIRRQGRKIFENLLATSSHTCQDGLQTSWWLTLIRQDGSLFLGCHNHRIVFVLHKLQLFQSQAISDIEVVSQFERRPLAFHKVLLQFVPTEFGKPTHKLNTRCDHFTAYFFVGVFNSSHRLSFSRVLFLRLTSLFNGKADLHKGGHYLFRLV